jgi:hypothetical protein
MKSNFFELTESSEQLVPAMRMVETSIATFSGK